MPLLLRHGAFLNNRLLRRPVRLTPIAEGLAVGLSLPVVTTKDMVMMTNVGSTKFVNFMTPWVVVPVLRCGHISHLMKMHFFLFSFCKHRGMD